MELNFNLSHRERNLVMEVWKHYNDQYPRPKFTEYVDSITRRSQHAPPITAEDFYAATGRHPENDDLERCNCSQAGETGHHMCGWNDEKNLPNFLVNS